MELHIIPVQMAFILSSNYILKTAQADEDFPYKSKIPTDALTNGLQNMATKKHNLPLAPRRIMVCVTRKGRKHGTLGRGAETRGNSPVSEALQQKHARQNATTHALNQRIEEA